VAKSEVARFGWRRIGSFGLRRTRRGRDVRRRRGGSSGGRGFRRWFFRLGFRCRRCGRRLKRRRFHRRRNAHGRRSRAHNMLGTTTGRRQNGRKKEREDFAWSHFMYSAHLPRSHRASAAAQLYLASQRQLDSKRRAASHFRLKVYRTIHNCTVRKALASPMPLPPGLVVKNS